MHTPGPYRIAKHDTLKDVYHVDAGPQGYERETVAICSGKRSKDNAALFAQAPAMLEALEDVLYAFADPQKQHDWSYTKRAAWNKAQAVIAQVKGV